MPFMSCCRCCQRTIHLRNLYCLPPCSPVSSCTSVQNDSSCCICDRVFPWLYIQLASCGFCRTSGTALSLSCHLSAGCAVSSLSAACLIFLCFSFHLTLWLLEMIPLYSFLQLQHPSSVAELAQVPVFLRCQWLFPGLVRSLL